jgi:hypothetical protein
MSYVAQLESTFLNLNITIDIESDQPLPFGWDALLPFALSQSRNLSPDVHLRFKVTKQKPTVNSQFWLPFIKMTRSVYWTKAGRNIRVKCDDPYVAQLETTELTPSEIFIHKPFQSATLSGRYRWLLLSELLESWIGWIAETRGFVRLHGLAVESKNRASVLIARQGFGKTSLALDCVKRNIAVLGEEVVYAKNLNVYSTRSVLREKSDHGGYHGIYGRRILHSVATPKFTHLPINLVAYGIRSPHRFWFVRCALDVFIGFGLPQNLDLTLFPLSLSNLSGWVRIAINRLQFLYQTKKIHIFPFERRQADTLAKTAGEWVCVLSREVP